MSFHPLSRPIFLDGAGHVRLFFLFLVHSLLKKSLQKKVFYAVLKHKKPAYAQIQNAGFNILVVKKFKLIRLYIFQIRL